MNVFNENLMLNKTVVVTGASSGLGKDLAKRLSFLGARVICLGRNTERLNSTIEELKKANHLSYLSNFSEMELAYKTFMVCREKVDKIDGVFHAAGEELVKPSKLTKNKDIEKTFSGLINGALGLAKASQTKDYFGESGGSIVFLSSVASKRGQFGMVAYSASRSAILGLNKSLSVELSPKKVRVNCIISGAVKTEMHNRIERTLNEKSILEYENKHVLGFGEPSDISNAAIYLLSDAGKWVTGSDWLIDGGYMVK